MTFQGEMCGALLRLDPAQIERGRYCKPMVLLDALPANLACAASRCGNRPL
jgi:hypothetical protein